MCTAAVLINIATKCTANYVVMSSGFHFLHNLSLVLMYVKFHFQIIKLLPSQRYLLKRSNICRKFTSYMQLRSKSLASIRFNVKLVPFRGRICRVIIINTKSCITKVVRKAMPYTSIQGCASRCSHEASQMHKLSYFQTHFSIAENGKCVSCKCLTWLMGNQGFVSRKPRQAQMISSGIIQSLGW